MPLVYHGTRWRVDTASSDSGSALTAFLLLEGEDTGIEVREFDDRALLSNSVKDLVSKRLLISSS